MSSISIFRAATRAVRPSGFFRATQLPQSRLQVPTLLAANRTSNFSTTCKRSSGAHEDETFEEFSARYGVSGLLVDGETRNCETLPMMNLDMA